MCADREEERGGRGFGFGNEKGARAEGEEKEEIPVRMMCGHNGF